MSVSPPRRALRVAVAGCGDGELAIALAVACPGDVVAAFDADPAAIAIARRRAAVAGVADRLTFEVAATILGGGYHLVYLARPPRRDDVAPTSSGGTAPSAARRPSGATRGQSRDASAC